MIFSDIPHLQVLDASSGRQHTMLTGPTKGVTCLAVNAEYVAATCEDFATYIYNAVSILLSGSSKQ